MQIWEDEVCVNALNGILSFLLGQPRRILAQVFCGVNALNGLLSFLREYKSWNRRWMIIGVNALNGLLSFLRYLLRAHINTGFASSFLQIFVWKFWNQAFFAHFLTCSQFVHIWRSISCLPQHKYFTKSINKMKAALLIFYHLSFSLYRCLSLHPKSLPDTFSQ